jgi:hypothetical protein
VVGARALAAVACLIAATGCAHAPGRTSVRQLPDSVSTTHVPGPVHTVIRKFRTYRAGQPGTLQAQAGIALRLTVSRPTVSRTRLSSSYGYPPKHGYYLTFRVAVVNTGSKPVQVRPTDFGVRIAHQGLVTSYDGNSPYSGAHRQLDTTEVAPGERLHAPLTFDVRTTHGRFDYRPDGSTALAWVF